MIKTSPLLSSQSTVKQFLQKHAVNLFELVMMNPIKDAISKINRRALYAISTTIMLSVFLSACGGGGGGGTGTTTPINSNTTPTGTTPPINANTTPTFSITSGRLTFNEDFASLQSIATVSNATSLAVNQSSAGVVSITTSVNGVSISNIANAFGQTTLTITASNGNLRASTQVVVTVNAINDTPTLTVTTNSISTLGGFAQITIGVTAQDVEQGTLTFTVDTSTLVRVTTSANAIFLDAIAGASGQTTLTVRISDNAGIIVTQIIAVDVTIRSNTSPQLMISTNRIIVLEDFSSSVVITATATDAENEAITLSISSTTHLVNAVSSVVANNRGSITLSAVSNRNGTTTLTVHATDAGGDSTSVEVVVVIMAVNDTPTLTVSTNSISTLGGFSQINIGVTAYDVEQGTLTFTVVASSLVRVTTSANAILLDAIAGASGQTTLTVRVSDNAGVTVTQTIAVDVSIVLSNPPQLMILTNRIIVQEDFTTSVVVTATVTDADGDAITLSISSTTHLVNAISSVVANTMSSITLSSVSNRNGTTTLTVRATDAGGQSTAVELVVVIMAVNDPPILIVSTHALVLNEDFASTQSVVTVMNVDGDAQVINVTESNSGVVNVTTSVSGVFVSSTANASGQTTLTIAVSDAQLTVTTQVAVTVLMVNDPPTITAITTTSLTLSEDFITTFSIAVFGHDFDGDTLTISVSESRRGVVSVTTVASSVRVSRIAHANGQTTLTISVNDGMVSASTQVVVQVVAVNDPPTITVTTNNISTIAGFSAITIGVTANDVEQGSLTFTVEASTFGVVRVTTSVNSIVLNAISGGSGQTILTVRTTDRDGLSASQIIAVNVSVLSSSSSPVLTVSTNHIIVQEGFTTPVVIAITAIDADGDSVNLSVSSASHLVDVAISPLSNGQSTITLTAIAKLNGTTTLTVRASDAGGQFDSTQIVVVVNSFFNPISLSLSTSVVSLSALGNQLNRNVQNVSISNPDNENIRAQFAVSMSGDSIFSANPTPLVSFSTTAVVTETTLNAIAQTAQLYFTIAPDRTGTATLTIQLFDLSRFSTSQQTMVVQVNPVAKTPVIAYTNPSIANLGVHGGHLYANSVSTAQAITSFLPEAKALGGHLININTVEEFNFVNALTNPIMINESWIGLVLPQLSFPGELSWVTDNSTIAYGFVSTTVSNVGRATVYPGHYNLNWNSAAGLIANRNPSSPPSVFNWTIYAQGEQRFYLLNDAGDQTSRNALYELPQGLTPVSMMPRPSIALLGSSSATVSLIGFDMNGDAINTAHWSARDPAGGTGQFISTYQGSGVQTVDMVYTPAPIIDGPTTVVVTLQVKGLSTTASISFTVDGPPIVALSTNTIVLNEDFTPFDIGTTVTEGLSRLPYTVQASSSGVVTITTSTNAIRLTPIAHVSGSVTLTVQAIDAAQQTVSTEVVVTVRAVNDPPTLSVSSDNISISGGFTPFAINTTAMDVEDGPLSFSVQVSTTGIVGISTSVNTITLSPLLGRSGQTTLTVSAIDTSNTTVIRIIAVNVIVSTSTTPVLSVSTNRIYIQEDFTTVVFIGTTATDAEQGRLTVTVTASTPLVNTVVSVQGITLSPMSNRHGTATLTVRAADTGGLFDSTEIVVIVTPVNDTPTLTVSPTVTLTTASIVLNVSASDLEDGILTFSASSGQNLVRATVTTTSLIISRLYSRASSTMLTLRTTDANEVTTTTLIAVTLSRFYTFTVTTGIKTLDFAWSAQSNAIHYQLRSNPDGNSGLVDLTTTGLVVSPNSMMIRQTTAQALVSLRHYIPRVSNPQYDVNICTTTPCGSSSPYNAVALSNVQLNSLIGRLRASNSGSSDLFGASVSLSGDGNTLAVGASQERSLATGVNGAQNDNSGSNVGAVYIFRRNGSDWSQQAYIKASNSKNNDYFGHSVYLSDDGNTLAVGATRENGGGAGINGPLNGNSVSALSGAAYVFRFIGGDWTQQAYIKAPIAQRSAQFGNSVSLSGDGNTLAVGEPSNSRGQTGVNDLSSQAAITFSGAAYVFRFGASDWTQQAYIKASNPGLSAQFGYFVSLSNDGNTLAVGARNEDGSSTGVNGLQNTSATNTGAAYVFRFSGSDWTQQAYIKASNTGDRDSFGEAVSLSSNGNTLAVGARFEDSTATGVNGLQNNVLSNTGAAYVFRFSGSDWTQEAYIKASNTGDGDFFGVAVRISADGNTLAVGANSEDSSASGVGGAESNGSNDSGAVYVFEFRNGTWTQQAYIKSNPNVAAGSFGNSLGFSNDGQTLVVGAQRENSSIGAVYLY